jgi:DNA polymerase beta
MSSPILDHKHAILSSLQILRQAELAAKAPFKARAYDKVIKGIQALSGPIGGFEDLSGVPGIGEKIAAKIQEIIETGALRAAQQASADLQLDVRELFQRVHGIGPVKADELVKAGHKTITDLRSAVERNPYILNDKQKVGLRYYEDLQERIPRAEIDQFALLLRRTFEGVGLPTMDIAGSYRRGQADSGDIDCLLQCPVAMDHWIECFHAGVKTLQREGILLEVLALGEKKCMAILRLGPTGKPRRLDILLTPSHEYPFALLHFTGSQQYNIQVRNHAIRLGYSLSEHGLVHLVENSGAPPVPPMYSEEDILAFLGLPWVAPECR